MYPRKEVVEKLLANAKSGKKLGLEITPAELKKYEGIWARQDFPEVFQRIREGAGSYAREKMGLGNIDLSFFSVATLAREKGMQIVPLDSSHLLKRASELESLASGLASRLDKLRIVRRDPEDNPWPQVPAEKVEELRRTSPEALDVVAAYHKAFYEMQYIDVVEREEHMAAVARANRVDIIAGGAAHHDGIKEKTGGHRIYRDEAYPSEFRREYNRRIARANAIKRELARKEMPRLPAPKRATSRKPERPKVR